MPKLAQGDIDLSSTTYTFNLTRKDHLYPSRLDHLAPLSSIDSLGLGALMLKEEVSS